MLTKDTTALIVIDVQEKLHRLMPDPQALERASLKLVRGASALGLPVIWAEQYPEGMGQTIPSLRDILPGRPLPKKAFSCLGDPALAQAIAQTGRRSFLLMGIEAHVCVWQTARDLLARGLSVEVVSDCVASRTEHDKQIGLGRIAAAGGQITSVEMCLFELLERAEGPAFKAILPIVK